MIGPDRVQFGRRHWTRGGAESAAARRRLSGDFTARVADLSEDVLL